MLCTASVNHGWIEDSGTSMSAYVLFVKMFEWVFIFFCIRDVLLGLHVFSIWFCSKKNQTLGKETLDWFISPWVCVCICFLYFLSGILVEFSIFVKARLVSTTIVCWPVKFFFKKIIFCSFFHLGFVYICIFC